MTTIPEHITQRAIETARAYNRDWENGVEIIEQALLAAEKRGREEERERCAKLCEGLSWQIDLSPDHVRARRPADYAAAIRSTN